MTKKKEKTHSEAYYDAGRNGWTPSTTIDDLIKDERVEKGMRLVKFAITLI